MLVCRPPLSVCNAVNNLKTLHAAYNESGVRRGGRPTFGEHLATVDGQAQLQALQERVETRLQEELRSLPPGHLPGMPHHATMALPLAAFADAAESQLKVVLLVLGCIHTDQQALQ